MNKILFFISDLFLVLYICNQFIQYKCSWITYNKMVINVCEKLRKNNILYVKIIQWNLQDFFNLDDDELVEYFSRFSSSVPYTSEDIDYDLISKIETQFDNKLYFDKTPINSGTTALVFKGTLDNKDVAIKLLRKDIHSRINTDIENIKDTLNNAMYFWSFFYNTTKNINASINKIINSNKPLLLDQCDLSKEMNNIEKFRDLLIDNECIVVPNVYSEFTNYSNNVMVMEYLDGTPSSNVDSKLLKKYADDIVGYIILSYVSNKIIHADLHPGNVLLLKDGRIGLIDFGIIVEISNHFANNLLKMFLAISNSNFNLLVDSFANLIVKQDCSDCDKKIIRELVMESLYDIKYEMDHNKNKIKTVKFISAVRKMTVNIYDFTNIDPKSLQILLSLISSVFTIDKFSTGSFSESVEMFILDENNMFN